MMLEFHINPPHEIMNRNKVFNQPLPRSVPPNVYKILSFLPLSRKHIFLNSDLIKPVCPNDLLFANTNAKLYDYVRITYSLDVLFDEAQGREVEIDRLTGHHESRNSEFSCQ
jgi:hypothetical protein